MKIEELKKDIEKHDMIYCGICHECSTPVEVTATLREDGAIVIGGTGSVYKTKQGFDTRYFFKCESCFTKNPILEDYKECEVYSRAIGYLRPTDQWNKGKKEEFKMRKVFTNTKGE